MVLCIKIYSCFFFFGFESVKETFVLVRCTRNSKSTYPYLYSHYCYYMSVSKLVLVQGLETPFLCILVSFSFNNKDQSLIH